MRITVAIVGEKWEATFARATLTSLDSWLPEDAEVIVSAELASAMPIVSPRPYILIPSPPGFQSYSEVRRRMLESLERTHQSVLLLAAGTLPAQTNPVEHLGATHREERVVEWLPVTKEYSKTVIHFRPPLHRPPAEPSHTIEQVGRLRVWKIDTGGHYFQALNPAVQGESKPVWAQYGSRRPVFTYNTNNFDEAPVEAHDDYVILASGLLGLRMIVDSQPSNGARIIVYDINSDQIRWLKFVLKVSGEISDFEKVIERFRSEMYSASVRSLLPHESTNASRQAEWYRKNHYRLAELVPQVEWEFVECDVWTAPSVLFNRLRPGRKLFFMYLDLFMVWHVNDDSPWVENYANIAASLEDSVKERVRAPVTFLPGERSNAFQIQLGSPFASV
jgi:hypothetical protein